MRIILIHFQKNSYFSASYLINNSKPESVKYFPNLDRKVLYGKSPNVSFLTNGMSLYPGHILSFGVPRSFFFNLLDFIFPF